MIYSIATIALGITSLYFGWRRATLNLASKLVGWALITAGIILATIYWGIEFGVIYGALFVSCVAWLLVSYESADWSPKDSFERLTWPALTGSTAARQTGLFVLAIVLSGVASMFTAVLLSQILPWAVTTRASFIVLLTPILWGALMVWVLISPRPAGIAVMLSCLISGFFLFVS